MIIAECPGDDFWQECQVRTDAWSSLNQPLLNAWSMTLYRKIA